MAAVLYTWGATMMNLITFGSRPGGSILRSFAASAALALSAAIVLPAISFADEDGVSFWRNLIGHAEAEVAAYQEKAERAEQWLHVDRRWISAAGEWPSQRVATPTERKTACRLSLLRVTFGLRGSSGIAISTRQAGLNRPSVAILCGEHHRHSIGTRGRSAQLPPGRRTGWAAVGAGR
jgi:hypothetical protein